LISRDFFSRLFKSNYLPAGAMQWIRNVGDVPLAFYVIVSPPWDEGQEVVFSE
jgi:mannose-6-phosphate isomerase-like protein (cupin superfamily)